MALSDVVQPRNPGKARILRLLGYGLAVIGLYRVLYYFHIVQFLHELANVSWRWVLLGMIFDVISYAVQGLRWKLLLTPFGRVRLTHAIRAVYAGLFTNLIFPLRPGEILRSYLLSASEEIGLGRVLGSVGVERFVDLVIATALLAMASLRVDLPRSFQRVADTLAIGTLLVLAILVLLIFYIEVKLGTASGPEAARRRLPGKVMAVLTDLHAMGTAPSFYTAVISSLLIPSCQVLGLWAMMHAYELHLPFGAAVVVLLVINLGVSLPNAPANFGSYQLFCVLGLNVFQIEKSTATGFSFFAFVALTLPLALLGFPALLRSGLSLRSMREKVGSLSRQALRGPA